MANIKTPKVQIELTIAELELVVKCLRSQRSQSDYYVERSDYTGSGDNADQIQGYAVRSAEDALPERRSLAALIADLTGEEVKHDSPERLAVLANARMEFDAQEAAIAAAKAEAELQASLDTEEEAEAAVGFTSSASQSLGY